MFDPTPAIIVDIDGTLADLTHRLHYVQDSQRDWKAFFDAMPDDAPIEPIIWLANTFYDAGNPVILCSGRPETHRLQTEEWLAKHQVRYNVLHMRAAGDFRKDHVVKKQMLEYIRAEGLYDVRLCVDDRPSIIRMWREEGLICLACKPEDSDFSTIPDRVPTLYVMVGPSGAGKTTWLNNRAGILPGEIVSTDMLRVAFCGNFQDQTKNDQVFRAYHSLIKARLWSGLDVYADATNIRNKDRLEVVSLAPPNARVVYIVINRSMNAKYHSAGWRAKLPFDLIAKHEQTFNSNLKAILAGDGLPNVEVEDLRV